MTFNIRDHLDNIKPSKHGKYFCPHCGKHNFTFNIKTGAYKCWNGCSSLQIRASLGAIKLPPKNDNPPIPLIVPLPNPVDIKIGQISPIRMPLKTPKQMVIDGSLQNVTSTIYAYSQTQFVERIDYDNGKTFRQYHVNPDGQYNFSKGKYLWEPYYLRYVINNTTNGNGILLVEGEKCVHYCLNNGIPATTIQGSCWDEWHYWIAFEMIKQTGFHFILCPDNDEAGEKKADDILNFSARMRWYTKHVFVPNVNDVADMNNSDFLKWVSKL